MQRWAEFCFPWIYVCFLDIETWVKQFLAFDFRIDCRKASDSNTVCTLRRSIIISWSCVIYGMDAHVCHLRPFFMVLSHSFFPPSILRTCDSFLLILWLLFLPPFPFPLSPLTLLPRTYPPLPNYVLYSRPEERTDSAKANRQNLKVGSCASLTDREGMMWTGAPAQNQSQGSGICHPRMCLFGIRIALSWLFLRNTKHESSETSE